MYKNVEIDLKPQPVLEELIKDLTNKILSYKRILAGCVVHMLIKILKKD